MNGSAYPPLLDQSQWVEQFAGEMRRLGVKMRVEKLQDVGLHLFKTYGPMRPEDVAQFEHRLMPTITQHDSL